MAADPFSATVAELGSGALLRGEVAGDIVVEFIIVGLIVIGFIAIVFTLRFNA
jgi:hypothetical protein